MSISKNLQNMCDDTEPVILLDYLANTIVAWIIGSLRHQINSKYAVYHWYIFSIHG